MGTIKEITVRVTEEEHSALKAKLPTQRTSFQALCYGWLMEWLAGGRVAAPEPVASRWDASEYAADCEKLLSILRDGGEYRRMGIRSNLDAFKGDMEREAMGRETGEQPQAGRKRVVGE